MGADLNMIARAGMAPETEDGRRWCPIAANSSHASKVARTAHGTVRRRLLSDGYFAGDFGSIYDRCHKPEQMAPSVGMSTGEAQKQALMCADATSGHESHESSHRLKPVPDVDGQRWCRACQVKLPVSAFPTGKRRYLCRQHLWRRCTRPCKERRLSNTNHRNLYRLWRRCWEDAKLSFGQKKITLLQKHIAQMLRDAHDGNHVKFAASLDRSSAYVLQNFSDCAAIVPADPEKVLSPSNAVVVDMPGRSALLRACKTGGAKRYAQALGEMAS